MHEINPPMESSPASISGWSMGTGWPSSSSTTRCSSYGRTNHMLLEGCDEHAITTHAASDRHADYISIQKTLLTCRMSATSGPLAAAGAAAAGCMCVGAPAGLRALAAATAAKSGLRMTPSLTPSTTDWRASSGGAGTSQPDTSTCWKPCAASSACQLVRLMSGEPAGHRRH